MRVRWPIDRDHFVMDGTAPELMQIASAVGMVLGDQPYNTILPEIYGELIQAVAFTRERAPKPGASRVDVWLARARRWLFIR
jgi:hypothetical protein